MGKAILIFASFACVLLSALPSSVANEVVVENNCTQDESQKKDMSCAHKFLEKLTQPSVNCSVELMRYRDCFKNFTLGQCFGGYLKQKPEMRLPMERMADIESKLHGFAQMMCGIVDPPINKTGLPEKVGHLLKCKPEYFDKAKDCAKAFFDKYKANRNSTDLCKTFMEAKMCNGDLMKEHCTFEKLPPHDHFNPFCRNNQDPPRPAGAADKAYTSGTIFVMGLAFYLFL